MIKKTIKFNGFDGEVQTEEWYFNITEAEATRLEAEFPGGMVAYIESFDENTPPKEILNLFERLLQRSVGKQVRTENGLRFVKNQEIVDDFVSSAAYSALFTELAMDTDKATAFFNGVLSKTFIEPPKPKSAQ